MSGAVIAYRTDQLGSRLLNLLYAGAAAEELGYRTLTSWLPRKRHDDEYSLYDLYDQEGLGRAWPSLTAIDRRDAGSVAAALGVPIEEVAAAPKVRDVLSGGPGGWSLSANVVRHDETSNPSGAGRKTALAKHWRGVARKIGSRLPPHPAIARALDLFDASELGRCTAVHIRRGDFVDGWTDNGGYRADGLFALRDLSSEAEVNGLLRNFVAKYVPLDGIARAIQDAAPVLIFADRPSDRADLAERLSGRVIDVHGRLETARLTPLQRAFCELLLMSKAGKILAPRSNFSGAAALLGDVPAFVYTDERRADELWRDVEGFLAVSPLSPADRATLRLKLEVAFGSEFAPRLA